MKRFASFSTEEIEEKKKKLTPKSTINNELSAANNFREYLREKGKPTHFETYSKKDIDQALTGFYVEARTREGQLYKKTSLESFRYGLNRYLKRSSQCPTFDLLKDPDFSNSNESFKVALQELKAEGKAEIIHYPPLTETDRQKLYTSVFFNTGTPWGLFNKVQYDIRYYFGRRGAENMHLMTKQSFVINKDPDTGRQFITKRDELTKNHRWNDAEAYGGFMPETFTPDCPVASFKKFVSKLDTDQNRFWCYPKDSFHPEAECWFTKKPVGINTLKQFLPRLSSKCGLSQIYTNHSMRSTAATLLHQEKFEGSAMKSVTGHKSLSSLAIYQHTSKQQKLEMADSLHNKISGKGRKTKASATVGPDDSHTEGRRHSPSRQMEVSEPATDRPTLGGGASYFSKHELENLNIVFDESNEPKDVLPRLGSLFTGCIITNVNITFNTNK